MHHAGCGFEQVSTFHPVWKVILSHIPSISVITVSSPLRRNHHLSRPEDVSLNFLLILSIHSRFGVVSFFIAKSTAEGGVFLKVPHTLLTPATGILVPCSLATLETPLPLLVAGVFGACLVLLEVAFCLREYCPTTSVHLRRLSRFPRFSGPALCEVDGT